MASPHLVGIRASFGLCGAAALLIASGFQGSMSPVAAMDPSILGSWQVDGIDAGTKQTDAFLATFGTDGTLIVGMPATHPVGTEVAFVSPGQGAWVASGNVVTFTFVQYYADATGSPSATLAISATVALAAGADTFAGEYSLSASSPTGSPLGKFTGTLTATRITVVAPASPAASAPPSAIGRIGRTAG